MTSAQFLELAVSLSLQAALAVIAAHWLGRLVNNERFRCRLWTGCYVTILLLIAVALSFPHPRVLHPWSAMSESSAVTLVNYEAQVGRFLFVAWLAGATLSALAFVVRSYRANAFLASCRAVESATFDFAEHSGKELGLSVGPSGRPVRLLSHPLLSTPFCWQFHQPFIVLPEFVLGFDQRELRFIVRHELEHLQTGHPLQLFLQRVVEGIFWFHPIIWWASRQSAESREYACDEAAIDSPAEIAMYLRTLLTIVEYRAAEAATTHTPLAFGRGRNIVVKRAQRLAQFAGIDGAVGRRLMSAPVAAISSVVAAVLIAFVWLPIDVLASPNESWSPWPTWSASVLHNFGVSARDFDVYDDRVKLHELLEHESDDEDGPPTR